MQEKSISSWKCRDSISWTLYMHLPQTKFDTSPISGEVLSKSVRQSINNTLALREVHVRCSTVVTALQAAYCFSGIFTLAICPTQLHQALETIQYRFSLR
ncbi:hypothetical protein AVEN_227631-1 [Araneus ventricosus]|uniref:Uncharacterized protein n=1 Tax=Araneus ventricosus TaxID=182803 RepID=A0A4Y2PUR7_ARAVE|nr:hypothetical protein AVEN_227631-1 [Araneus ventricosus]